MTDKADKNNNTWRSQLNLIYRKKSIESDKQDNNNVKPGDFIHTNNNNNENNAKLTFPPFPRIENLKEIDHNNFIKIYESRSYKVDRNRKSIQVQESLAAIELLEGLFDSILNETEDTRNNIINISKFLNNLPFPPGVDDIFQIKNDVVNELKLISESSSSQLDKMAVFEIHRMNSMVYTNESAFIDPIRDEYTLKKRLSTISECAQTLNFLINETIQFAVNLLCYCRSLYDDRNVDHYNNQVEYTLDDISIDWNSCRLAYLNHSPSGRAVNFSIFMRSKNLPVCASLYRYLHSPRDSAFVMSVCDYSFQKNEFKSIFDYLLLQHNLSSHHNNNSSSVFNITQQLVFHNCKLTDTDALVASHFLHLFPSLRSLSLKANSLTSSGIHFLMDSLCSCRSVIRSINLDDNAIDSDGLDSIAQSLSFLGFLQTISVSNNQSIGDEGIIIIVFF